MRPLASAVVCALALSLGACTEDEPPPSPPTTATSATTPANPDATLPPMPERAQEDSHRGITEFVTYYLDVLTYANLTGDTAELERVSSTSCSACQSYIAAVRDLYGAGGFITGGARAFDEAEVRFLGPDAESFATADVDIAAGTKRNSAQGTAQPIESSTMRLTFGITGNGDDRKISRIFQGDLG